MKNKKIITISQQFQNSRKIIDRVKGDTTNTQIHNHSLSLLGTGTSI